MKLSIIIPALNEEKYIYVLLDSLIAQTFKDFEVIVVDGNSSDLTRDVVMSYKNVLNIKCVNAMRKGVSYQRNMGAKLSTYDNLVFLDADGYAEQNFLLKIVDFLQEHLDTDIMTTWVSPISDRKIDKLLYFAYNQFYLSMMKNIKPQGGGAFVYIRRRAFEKLNGFNEDIFIGEDHDIYARAHQQGLTYYLLRDPSIQTSVRRLDSDGRLRHVLLLARGAVHMHFVGPIENPEIIDYVMEGGKSYKNEKVFSKTMKMIEKGLSRIKV